MTRLSVAMATPETKAAASAVPPSPEKAGKPTTLLDMHEVEWITRELERLLVRESGGAAADARHHHRRKRAEVKVVRPVRSHEPHAQTKRGGFLSELLGKHAASICGDDVGAVVSGRRRRGRGGFREVDKV
uniref:Uncharacterized protein n=1 Tax=Avena sativa TaxID=4498 RepID=A0ACD5Z6Y3_AVESA